MNREIEFRGKLSHSGEWVFGSLLKIDSKYHIANESDMYEDGHHICQESDAPTWVDPDTVGQFTGLLDKHGVKIFEGDIVRIYDGDYEEYSDQQVKFAHGVFGVDNWTKKTLTTLSFFMGCDSEYSVEVIGNIYENLDLLSSK